MENEKKRRPIRSQVQRLVLMIAVAALALAGILAVLSMRRIQSISQEYLLDRMEHNLSSTVQSKAELADSELGKYAGYVEAFAEYLHQLYASPKEQVKRISTETGKPEDQDVVAIRSAGAKGKQLTTKPIARIASAKGSWWDESETLSKGVLD